LRRSRPDPAPVTASGLPDHLDRAVVVAVVAMRVVKVAADEVVDVIAVRNRLVSAVRSVLMVGVVLGAVVIGRAVAGVRFADGERVALDAPRVMVVQLAVVEMVDVIVVADGGVAAARAVLVLRVWRWSSASLRS
jgi:hypothetical protein